MRGKAHKDGNADFADLTPAEQAKSITAMIVNIEAAMRHHIRVAKEPERMRRKCLRQLNRAVGRVIGEE